MNQKSKQAAAFVAGIVATLTVGALSGCQGAAVNTRNDPAFVQAADRFVNTTVGPEYETYIQNDPALGPVGQETPARQSRLENVRTFRDAVNQASQETAQTGG